MSAEPEIEILRNEAMSRFETGQGRDLAVLEYKLNGFVLSLTHTEVPQERGGQGIATKLTEMALSYAEAHGLKVRPVCPFVAAYMKKHPDTQKLLAPEGFAG